ncbi:conserved hypothetical protein, partial [Ricinus communis]
MAICIRTRSRVVDLVEDFLRRIILRRCADAAREQARPHVAALRVLRQPVIQQHVVRLTRLADAPVQLRREIIEPAILKPRLRIGVQLVVLRKADDAARAAVRAAQAERTDAEAHPALFAVDAVVQRLDQAVDVLAPPRRAVEPPAAGHVALPRGLIREVQLGLRGAAFQRRAFRAGRRRGLDG